VTVQPGNFPLTYEPISAEQYDALPEDRCADIEIVDGMVRFSPKSTAYLSRLATYLCDRLGAAGGPDWHSVHKVDLRPRDVPLMNFQADVVVHAAETPRGRRVPVSAVVMVVEVVSPGSESTDRVLKPLEYAKAGIPHFWRVEPSGDVPVIHTYTLDPGQRVYRKTGEFTGTVKVESPFPVEIDLTDV